MGFTMQFPHVAQQLTPRLASRWDREYVSRLDRPRDLEEGLWRRTQDPRNVAESGWSAPQDARRRMHGRAGFDLLRHRILLQ